MVLIFKDPIFWWVGGGVFSADIITLSCCNIVCLPECDSGLQNLIMTCDMNFFFFNLKTLKILQIRTIHVENSFFFFDNKRQGPSSLMHFFLTCIQAARSKWMHGDL